MLDDKMDSEGMILPDGLNLKIIKDLMNDADVKNTSLAKRYNSPLSTIHRRRTRLRLSMLVRLCVNETTYQPSRLREPSHILQRLQFFCDALGLLNTTESSADVMALTKSETEETLH